MNTKKIYMSLVTYLLLTAVISIISMGISDGTKGHFTKAVVNSDQGIFHPELNLLLEEENDSDTTLEAACLMQPWFIFSALVFIISGIANYCAFASPAAFKQLPIFIRHKTLRL